MGGAGADNSALEEQLLSRLFGPGAMQLGNNGQGAADLSSVLRSQALDQSSALPMAADDQPQPR